MRTSFVAKTGTNPLKNISKTAIVKHVTSSSSQVATAAYSRLLTAQQHVYLDALSKKKARVLLSKRQKSTPSTSQRLLSGDRTSNVDKRRAALWQARSSRAMQRIERSLSA